MSLLSRMEVRKLARELHVDADELAELEAVAPEDLRTLRGLVGDTLQRAHRSAFRRAVAVSALLPAPLIARLSQTVVGPWLSARIAAEMPPDRSARLASHLDTSFLADVCLSLDPARVADTVSSLPDEQVVAVGLELLARGEHDTLGKFVDVVRPAVVDAVADHVDDPLALLHIAAAIEAPERLDEVVDRIPDERLAELLPAAAEHDELATALAVASQLGPANQRRIVSLASDAGPDVLDALVAAATAEQAWGSVMELLRTLDAEAGD